MKKENTIKQIRVWSILLLVCVFCITYYRLELLLSGTIYYEIKSMSLYILIALPVLYLSVGAIVGLIFQYWSNNYITAEVRKYFMVGAISFILIFAAILISFKITTTPNWILQGISYYPILFIVPGILLSIGLSFQTS